jgi:hypothetical protein
MLTEAPAFMEGAESIGELSHPRQTSPSFRVATRNPRAKRPLMNELSAFAESGVAGGFLACGLEMTGGIGRLLCRNNSVTFIKAGTGFRSQGAAE